MLPALSQNTQMGPFPSKVCESTFQPRKSTIMPTRVRVIIASQCTLFQLIACSYLEGKVIQNMYSLQKLSRILVLGRFTSKKITFTKNGISGFQKEKIYPLIYSWTRLPKQTSIRSTFKRSGIFLGLLVEGGGVKLADHHHCQQVTT